MKFSQRIGKSSVRDSIQIESIDKELENRIWNTILENFFDEIGSPYFELLSRKDKLSNRKDELYLLIWKEFFKERSDEIPSSQNGNVYFKGFINYIKRWFFNSQWYEKYDFIEFLSEMSVSLRIGFTKICDKALKREMAGYRIVENKIVQITSEEEIIAIEEAITNSSKFKPVNTHLNTAIEFLSNRKNPDYRNSIKESISAVESICIIIAEDNDASLSQALKIIEKTYQIHGALKKAFSSLYGYTSDSGGIRHSLLEQDTKVTLEDAKFMLVSCSAFINYLKVKIQKD